MPVKRSCGASHHSGNEAANTSETGGRNAHKNDDSFDSGFRGDRSCVRVTDRFSEHDSLGESFHAGVVVADAFTAPVSAALSQISVVVDYEILPQFGITGTSPLLLTLLTDNHDSPGTPIESWILPLLPSDTSLTIVTGNSITNAVLLAGDQYWVSVVPTDPVTTGIGWGLTTPGIQLPVAETLAGVNAGWLPAQLNLANEFSVSGTVVPEPATFGTPALVLLMIGGLRGKRMRRAFIP
jgi:hypothetical protein